MNNFVEIIQFAGIIALAVLVILLNRRITTMHKHLVEAAQINQSYIDRNRDKYYEVARMVGHLADRFGLQYETSPEQGRWVPSDPIQRMSGMNRDAAGIAQGYCADGSGDLAAPKPDWREHVERLHKELSSRDMHLNQRLEQARAVMNLNWEGMHERVNELASKLDALAERLPKPRIRVARRRS